MGFIKRNKTITIIVLMDLSIYLLLFPAGLVLPWINPTDVQYRQMIQQGYSLPRDFVQTIVWYMLHFPSSVILAGTEYPDTLMFLSVFQTGLIVHLIQQLILRIRRWLRGLRLMEVQE